MLEAIQFIRDIVIILAFVICTGTVVIVGRALLQITRQVENVRSFATAAATCVVNPVRGVRGLLLALTRHRKPL